MSEKKSRTNNFFLKNGDYTYMVRVEKKDRKNPLHEQIHCLQL